MAVPPAQAPQRRSRRTGLLAGGGPFFIQRVQEEHPDKRIELWGQDEMRVGQQGTNTRVWAETGSRPRALKQTQYEWVYLYAAVNAETGEDSPMLAPTVNRAYMNEHLRMISEALDPDAHAVLALDRAGYHTAKDLKVPENITLLYLPPYSPELNAAERPWAYLRDHFLSNCVFKNYADLFRRVADAWRSLCRMEWLMPTN